MLHYLAESARSLERFTHEFDLVMMSCYVQDKKKVTRADHNCVILRTNRPRCDYCIVVCLVLDNYLCICQDSLNKEILD